MRIVSENGVSPKRETDDEALGPLALGGTLFSHKPMVHSQLVVYIYIWESSDLCISGILKGMTIYIFIVSWLGISGI